MGAIAAGLCDAPQQERCRNEFGEENLEWACSKCKQKRAEDLGERTLHLMRLRSLIRAGYPFGANDLTLELWEDLSQLEEVLREAERNRPIPVIWVRPRG